MVLAILLICSGLTILLFLAIVYSLHRVVPIPPTEAVELLSALILLLEEAGACARGELPPPGQLADRLHLLNRIARSDDGMTEAPLSPE